MIITNLRAYIEYFMQLAYIFDLDENRPPYTTIRA